MPTPDIDPDVDRIAEDERIRQHVREAADEIRDRLDLADTITRGAMLDAGMLTITVQRIRDEREDIGVDVSRLADRIDISRPTLYKYAGQVSDADTSGALRTLSSAALARLHLGYGLGGHDGVAEELWSRFPHQAGWYRAYQFLAHPDDEVDPWATQERPRSEAATKLIKKYREWVDQLAAER